MTAFAAIVGTEAADPCAVDRISSVLGSVYRSRPVTRRFEGCVLLAAPLPCDVSAGGDPAPHDPAGHDEAIVVDAPTRVAAAGQVMLEGRAALARQLGLEPSASALSVCAAALDRWTAAFTGRISGEFAVVLWDARRGALTAARDGLGLRQLFAAQARGVTVVSNIAAAILAHPSISADLDSAAIAHYLAHGSLAPGRTAFGSVSPVPAGHTLHISGRDVLLRRHWTFPETRDPVQRSPEETLAGYRHVLEQAAGDRLTQPRASILLSAGIDSTTIAAAARSAAPAADLRAFTADYTRVPAASELPLARLAAGALGIPLTPVPGDACPALHYLRAREEMPPQPMDEPALSDWRGLIAAAAAHAPVVLYGEDGDSLFLPPGLQAMRQTMPVSAVLADTTFFALRHGRLPYLGMRLRERFKVTARRADNVMPSWLTSRARSLAQTATPASVLGQEPHAPPVHTSRPRTAERLQTGVAEYLAPLIAAEATGQRAEVRCPLLDSRVIAFVMNVPPIPWCQSKFLPRQAYRHVLPAAIHQRSKRGIAGVDEALTTEWLGGRPAVDAVLPSPLDEWVDVDVWRHALSQPVSTAAAWRVLQLAAWLAVRRSVDVKANARV